MARSDHTRSPHAEAASLPQDSPRTCSENGGLGQIKGPRNAGRNGTACVYLHQARGSSQLKIIKAPADSPPETQGQAPLPPLPSTRSRQESASAQPDEALGSQHHSSGVKQSAPGGALPASTDPDGTFPTRSNGSTVQIRRRLEIDELRDGFSSATGKRSQRLKALDHTGQLEERTKPKFIRSFSDVSQAKLGDRVVAVKALRVANIEDGEGRIWKRLAREIYVWAALDHPNVLELLGFATEDGRPCLISPWCDNGTLQDCLQKFPDANRRRLVREIAEGLGYLHMQTPPIIHGDLKTVNQVFHLRNRLPKTDDVYQVNVFVTGDCVAKISDFGGSRRVEEFRTGFTTAGLALTTTRYTAPEILQGDQHLSLSSDVFSFACVALETMTDKCPFWRIQNDVQVITEVVFRKQTPSPEDHPGMEETLWELLRGCWNYEPSDRPKMIDVCKMVHLSLQFI
ncbi:hypothetical protein FS837_012781 [Tulasnella sp. UAMH 9824]|nr:hypothetical protein FS837_012781 [Tulasnella sp. UAMH 9824]